MQRHSRKIKRKKEHSKLQFGWMRARRSTHRKKKNKNNFFFMHFFFGIFVKVSLLPALILCVAFLLFHVEIFLLCLFRRLMCFFSGFGPGVSDFCRKNIEMMKERRKISERKIKFYDANESELGRIESWRLEWKFDDPKVDWPMNNMSSFHRRPKHI